MKKPPAKKVVTPAPPAAGKPRKPLYQQVVAALRDEILKGTYPVGSQLPTEGELVDRFAVSRHTVREALRSLRGDGLVSSRQGAGTRVARPSSMNAYVQEIESISDLIQYASTTRYRVDRSELVQGDAQLAAQTGTPLGQKWLRIDGLRYESGHDKPMCRTVVYVHADYAGVGRLVGKRQGAIYELIEDLYGEQIAEVEQVVAAYRAPDGVARELGIDEDAVVMEVKRLYRTVSRKVAQVAVNQFPAEGFTVAMKLRRSGAA